MDAPALVPVMQQSLDAELVEDGPVLRELASLEVADQADRREHQGIAGEVADVGVTRKPGDDVVAVLDPFDAGLLLGLVLGEADGGAPVTRVLGHLGGVEIEQVALGELEGAQEAGRVSDGAGRDEVLAIGEVAVQLGEPGDQSLIAQVGLGLVQAVEQEEDAAGLHHPVDPAVRHERRPLVAGRGLLDQGRAAREVGQIELADP